jgi:hypothetical protein
VCDHGEAPLVLVGALLLSLHLADLLEERRQVSQRMVVDVKVPVLGRVNVRPRVPYASCNPTRPRRAGVNTLIPIRAQAMLHGLPLISPGRTLCMAGCGVVCWRPDQARRHTMIGAPEIAQVHVVAHVVQAEGQRARLHATVNIVSPHVVSLSDCISSSVSYYVLAKRGVATIPCPSI